MKKTAAAMLILALLFSACSPVLPGSDPSLSDPSSVAGTTAPESSPPEISAPEAAVPETTVPETEPPLEAGGTVYLSGIRTESWLLDGQTYVSAERLSEIYSVKLEASSGAVLLDDTPQAGVPVLCREEGVFLGLSAVAELLDLESYQEPGGPAYFYPAPSENIPEGIQVPILMYHAVSDDIVGIEELHVSPSNMEDQLAYLVENGYDPIFFSDLPHLEDYDKPVILTFDDGYEDNYSELFPLLKKYGVKATIFIITDYMGYPNKMNWEQIQEMSLSGLVSIQSHTATHRFLSELSEDELVQEMERSQTTLLKLTGIKPYVLCYPSGDSNSLAREVASRYYSFGLIMGPAGYVTGSDPYLVGRHYVSRYTDLGSFAWMVSAAGETA